MQYERQQRVGVATTAPARCPEAEEFPHLNSDQISTRFGSYGVDVLRQTSASRLANLYSRHGDKRVCRTLALTHFTLPLPECLIDIDKDIRAGASIGATLRAAGWRVVRSDPAFVTASAGEHFKNVTADSVDIGSPLAIQVYTLQVVSDTERFDYATIAEAYHPEHVPPSTEQPDIANALQHLPEHQRAALKELAAAL